MSFFASMLARSYETAPKIERLPGKPGKKGHNVGSYSDPFADVRAQTEKLGSDLDAFISQQDALEDGEANAKMLGEYAQLSRMVAFATFMRDRVADDAGFPTISDAEWARILHRFDEKSQSYKQRKSEYRLFAAAERAGALTPIVTRFYRAKQEGTLSGSITAHVLTALRAAKREAPKGERFSVDHKALEKAATMTDEQRKAEAKAKRAANQAEAAATAKEAFTKARIEDIAAEAARILAARSESTDEIIAKVRAALEAMRKVGEVPARSDITH